MLQETALLSTTEWKTILDRLTGSTETGTLRWTILDTDPLDGGHEEWCYHARVTQRTEYRVAVARGRRNLELTVSALWHRPAVTEPTVIATRSLVGLSAEDHALFDSAAALYHAATRSASGAPQATAATLIDEIDEIDRRRARALTARGCEERGILVA